MTTKRVQHIRFDPPTSVGWTGLEGEITVELDTFLLRVHDGITPGGWPTLTKSSADSLYASLTDFNESISSVNEIVENAINNAVDEITPLFLISRGPVLAIVTALPPTPSAADRYLLSNTGLAGEAVGHENQVAEFFIDVGWVFSTPPLEGASVLNQADNKTYYFNGVLWTLTPVDETILDLGEEIDAINAALLEKAPLASPALTGTPTAPTPAVGDDSTKIATTAFVQDAVEDVISGAGFGSSLGGNGYQNLPSGLIMQWGTHSGSSSQPTINFPIAFPNVCFGIQCTSVGTGDNTGDLGTTQFIKTVNIRDFSAVSFRVWCTGERATEDVFMPDSSPTFYWLAYGK